MQVATGTVINGKIVVEGVDLPEGLVVAVLARGADEAFALSAEDEDELLAAISEMEHGEYVTIDDLLRELPR
ncbi:hypothetical protein [Ramlibacter sp.]|uniref:hypothetical protein n=1 Tax=Ramlibacter sp. TaxID=1917967 RepID=UPI0035AD790B